MPRYYCDYCDTHLTHDSPSVRKQHNAGYKHKANVRAYYQKFEEQQTQVLIDQKIKEHLGQAAMYQQIGAAYNQHLAAFPGGRPRLPLIPPPMMPFPGTLPPNFATGMRPPVLPIPVHAAPGYAPAPGAAPAGGQSPASSLPMPPSGLPIRAPTSIPAPVAGGVPAPASSGLPPASAPAGYQVNGPGTVVPPRNAVAPGYSYAQAPQPSH